MPFFVVFVFGIAAKGYFPRCISKCARISHTLRANQQHFRLVHHRWASLTIFLAGLCDKNKSFPSCLSFKKQKIKTHTLKRISGTKRRFYYYYFFVENRSFIHHTDHLPLLLGLQIITQQAQENSLLLNGGKIKKREIEIVDKLRTSPWCCEWKMNVNDDLMHCSTVNNTERKTKKKGNHDKPVQVYTIWLHVLVLVKEFVLPICSDFVFRRDLSSCFTTEIKKTMASHFPFFRPYFCRLFWVSFFKK